MTKMMISSYFKQAEMFYLCTNSKFYMEFIVYGHITSNILNRDVERDLSQHTLTCHCRKAQL